MALLRRDEILAADDLKTEDVEVPEWGGTVRIKMLTGSERDHFENSLIELRKDGTTRRNAENARARLVSLVIINEAGEREFLKTDVEKLGRKSAAALQRVFNAAQELNAVSDDDIEELTENFGDGPSESSTSDSPAISDTAA